MAKIEFTRGDEIHHSFSIPASNWSPGGKLFFAAKLAIDDDTTDAAALIDQHWDDASVSDVVINGIAYKKYDCLFTAEATSNIESDGASSVELLGEFQYVTSSGVPTTFPAKDEKLECIVYFDVKRKTTI